MKTIIKSIAVIALCSIMSLGAEAATIEKMNVAMSNGSFALARPIYTNALALAASTAEAFTVPTGPNGSSKAQYVNFSAGCDFYVNYTTTATIPSDTTNGSASELNPTVRWIDAGVTSISVIANSACVVTASFYM